MSTSNMGVPARIVNLSKMTKAAALIGTSCLLVLAGGAGAKPDDAKGTPFAVHGPAAQAPRVIRGAEATEAFTPIKFAVDLRTLPAAKAWKPGDAIKEIPKRSKIKPGKQDVAGQAAARAQTADVDPLLAAQEAAKGGPESRAFSDTILNFAGSSFTGANPPDTVGDIGQNYFIQLVNGGGTTVRIYDKTDGSLAVPAFNLEDLWPGGGFCANGLGDPIVLYDDLADRWLLSEFSSSGNRLCIYISQTDDPIAGGWYAYEVSAPSFPDYPKYAVWPDAYYISSNETSAAAYAIDRVAMLNGLPATFQRFAASDLAGFGFQALQAADVDGPAAPPAGSPGIFMRHRDDEAHNVGSNNPTLDFLEIFEFDVDFATPGNSTFTGPIQIPISEIDSELCGFFSFSCFPQPGTGTQLDPLREVIMFPLVYRNFGGYEAVVGNLVTDVDATDHGGVRWFELRKSGGGAWSLFQEGTYAPDADSRFMGAIGMDEAGNIAVGYNVSSSSQFPSLRYAGRLASDPVGTLPQGEHSIAEGSASNSSNRYGDYSAMGIDPVDDCTFWFTGMYNQASSWSTRIASFRFDACGSPGFSLSAAPSNPQVCAPGPVEPVNVNIGSIADFTGPVTLSLDLPAGISGSISPNPANAPGSASISLTASGAAAAGNNIVGVMGTSPGADDRETAIIVGVTTAVPATATLLAPANGATDQSLTPALSWTDTGAAEYLVEIASDAGFSNIVDSATVSGTSYSATGLSVETTYYWRVTGSNICGDGDTSATFSFTTGLLICSDTPLVMPDGVSAGVTQDLVVGTTGAITDLNVFLRVTHTWVGDLIFRLENVGTGTVVTLMDRPGVPPSTVGCSADDVNATFDDEGNYVVETACVGPGPGPEGIAGFPIPQQPLSAFDGLDISGTWRLFASDNFGADTGQVDEWCLLPALTGGDPDSDKDGVPDSTDNCTDVANPLQRDSNGDGIGNYCDPDLDNNCTVDFLDVGIFKSAFLSNDPDADFNGLGNPAVDFTDLGILKDFFLLPPGPSAEPNDCQ